jgi:hypothetical protein
MEMLYKGWESIELSNRWGPALYRRKLTNASIETDAMRGLLGESLATHMTSVFRSANCRITGINPSWIAGSQSDAIVLPL